MNKQTIRKVLAAALCALICGAIFFLKRGRYGVYELLLAEVLFIFSYAAACLDLTSQRVPNKLVLVMIAAWFVIVLPPLILQRTEAGARILRGLIGFGISAILMLLVYLISRKGLGGGDVKFIAVTGLYLGISGVLTGLLIGSVLAALTALVLMLLKKIKKEDSFPFVPFLAVGMTAVILLG